MTALQRKPSLALARWRTYTGQKVTLVFLRLQLGQAGSVRPTIVNDGQ